MDSLEQFDTSRLNEVLQNSTPSLIHESFIYTIQTAVLTLTILGGIFLVLYVFTIVRKWKVDSAILQMQKDVAQIKVQLNTSPNHKSSESVQDEKTIL